jgi:hypothetical protein
MMQKLEFKKDVKNTDTTKTAIEVSKFLDLGTPSGTAYTIATDIQERAGGTLMNLNKDIFSDKPLNIQFKVITYKIVKRK